MKLSTVEAKGTFSIFAVSSSSLGHWDLESFSPF